MDEALVMMTQSFAISIVIVVVVLIALAVFIVMCFRKKASNSENERTTGRRYVNRGGRIVTTNNQQEDVYNISGRVQGQGQWPTHDAHVSLDNFAITNEYNNKYNDSPPTYEEAMRIATINSLETAAVPKTTTTTTTTTPATAPSTTNASNQ